MDNIIHVWNLFLINAPKDGLGSRPTVINFSSKAKMQKHVTEIVLKNTKLDADFRTSLEFYAKLGSEGWEGFMKNFRAIQLENSQPLGFDLWYEEEPQVLL